MRAVQKIMECFLPGKENRRFDDAGYGKLRLTHRDICEEATELTGSHELDYHSTDGQSDKSRHSSMAKIVTADYSSQVMAADPDSSDSFNSFATTGTTANLYKLHPNRDSSDGKEYPLSIQPSAPSMSLQSGATGNLDHPSTQFASNVLADQSSRNHTPVQDTLPTKLSDVVLSPALPQKTSPLPTVKLVKTAREIHNGLVLESGLSPQHPALAACWLTKCLGHGAFSKVYLAQPRQSTDGKPQVPYALKVVNLGSTCKLRDDYKVILRGEGANLDYFEQPGFVKCHGTWGSVPLPGSRELPEHLVLAMENLSGGMLLDHLKKGAMQEHHAAAVFYQILTCIMYMHHEGYVHRDLKPDNVMLTSAWDPVKNSSEPPPVKLIDLGMVLNYVQSPDTAGLMGSPGYMAPEAIRGHRHTPAMDMFSLGVVLFVMLTGCKPIPSAVCTKLSYDTMEACDYPGLKMSQFKDLSPEAQDLVLSLMERRPHNRPHAKQALAHQWLTSNIRLWRANGRDIRYLSVTSPTIKSILVCDRSVTAAASSSSHRHRKSTTAGTPDPKNKPTHRWSSKTHPPVVPHPSVVPHPPVVPLPAVVPRLQAPLAAPSPPLTFDPTLQPLNRRVLRATPFVDRAGPLSCKEETKPEAVLKNTPCSLQQAESPNTVELCASLTSGCPPASEGASAPSHTDVSHGALSSTINNMLSILNHQQGADKSGSTIARSRSTGPPSAKAISQAMNAVVDAAKLSQVVLLPPSTRSFPPSNPENARNCLPPNPRATLLSTQPNLDFDPSMMPLSEGEPAAHTPVSSQGQSYTRLPSTSPILHGGGVLSERRASARVQVHVHGQSTHSHPAKQCVDNSCSPFRGASAVPTN